MPQKAKLTNMKLSSYQQVKSIIDSILQGVSKAITIRTAAGSLLLEIIEDTMFISESNDELRGQYRAEREAASNSLRQDWLVLKYRSNPSLSITNPISGIVYETFLRYVDRQKLEEVGYDVTTIIPGTMRHVYAVLRSLMLNIRRSTSIRIWYTNGRGDNVEVPADGQQAIQLVHEKLFMTKIWGHKPTTTPDGDLHHFPR